MKKYDNKNKMKCIMFQDVNSHYSIQVNVCENGCILIVNYLTLTEWLLLYKYCVQYYYISQVYCMFSVYPK